MLPLHSLAARSSDRRPPAAARPHDERDARFAWSAIYGAISMRSGRTPAALGPVPVLTSGVVSRGIRTLRMPAVEMNSRVARRQVTRDEPP